MNNICQIKDVYKALYAFEKEFSTCNGITINEATLLCCLKDGNPKSASELSDFVGLSNSRVSRIINSMERKNYITRMVGKMDKRQMIFTLTGDGKSKIQEMMNVEMDFYKCLEIAK